MKESYTDDIMLCFVQGFNNAPENEIHKTQENRDSTAATTSQNSRPKRAFTKQFSLVESRIHGQEDNLESRDKALRMSLRVGGSGYRLPESRRSLSDRFAIITDAGTRKASRGLSNIRKTWSTGNFASGVQGGGCGAPRSAPATPLQLEPHCRSSKHDKHGSKSLSGSVPSVRVAGVAGAGDSTDGGKQQYKSRQKKFQRHFPQVGPEERVLNYYSCALVGDLLLQGHLYITKNYFAFYSNVFGYVTKLLIPTTSVLRITKEKVARIIPNAVGVCTKDERHVFGSLLSRDSTYKLMTHVWKAARVPELVPPPQELRTSEVEMNVSEYSPEDDSSSMGADQHDPETASTRRESDAMITSVSATVIQPALLAGAPVSKPTRERWWRPLLICVAVLLTLSAAFMTYRLYRIIVSPEEQVRKLSGEELYSEIVRWRTHLHGRAATELHSFLNTNLMLLTKVRQSLEALSGVILTDMAQAERTFSTEVPNDTVLS